MYFQMQKPKLQFKILLFIGLIFLLKVSFADEVSDLRSMVEKQQKQIEEQRQMINTLLERMNALEGKEKESFSPKKRVDLGYEEVEAIKEVGAQEHILSKEWFRRFEVSGFGAAGFLRTGQDAKRPKGGFLNYEASLFVDADVWDDASFFSEIQTVRLGDENTKFIRTAEVYLHLKNVLKNIQDDLLGIKIGRMDIPYGEEYLWQDAIDNPLITYTASWPYGWDEGILFYGRLGKLGWVFSLMDGSDVRGIDDDTDKAVNLKLYGKLSPNLYLSASLMRNGEAAQSAIEFAGSHIEPVGRGDHSSILGTSPSTKVRSYLYELDARYTFNTKGYLALTFGQVFVDDDLSSFDRDFIYFSLEPLYNLSDKLYLISRFSCIGTFDRDEGYHFDGKPYADGNSKFGYDTKSLFRLAFGLGYRLNPRTLIKLEYSHDDFRLIRQSNKNAANQDRDLIGAQVAVRF